MYNTEVFKEPPTSWSVVFEEQTLPDGQSNKGRVQAYDGPIHIADAAQYLMAHKPELGITSPYELTEEQYDAALDLLRQQRQLVGRYWHDAFIQIDDFKNEGVVASGSWPFQVNLLKSERRADRLDDPRGGRHRLGRHHDDARRRRAPELRLPLDGAHALLEPAERPLGLVRRQPGGAGRLHRRLAACRPPRAAPPTASTTSTASASGPRRSSTCAAGRVRALLPLGLRLHRGDRRPLTRAAGMTRAVEFEGVSRHFGAVRAVDGVDLAIERGRRSSPCSGPRARARPPACG